MKDDSAEILIQSFLQEALVSSSGMGRDVHSLVLSILHFLCRPRRRLPFKVSRRMVRERLSWRVTCPNQSCKLPSLDSCQKSFLWKEVDLAQHSVVGLVLQAGGAEKFLRALGFEILDPFSESASKVLVSQPQRRIEVTRDL